MKVKKAKKAPDKPDKASEWTIGQRLLIVARTLPSPFTMADLTVAAWRSSSAVFGMVGYEKQYPDAHRVASELSHRRGIVHKGMIRKVAPRTYTMTERGKAEAELALQSGRQSIRNPLSTDLASELERILSSTAYFRTRGGMGGYCNWPDAEQFWGYQKTEGPLKDAIQRTEKAIDAAKAIVDDQSVICIGGRSVSSIEIAYAQQTALSLRAMFRPKLNWLEAS